MKNFIKKYYKNTIVWVILLVIFTLFQVYSFYKSEITEKEKLIQEANKPSKIEEIASSIDNLKNEAEKQKQIQENAKIQYETAIWKQRCFEQNLILEAKKEKLEDCDSDLERFSSYNLKK